MANFHYVQNGDIRLRVAIEGEADAPLVILVHGFPESWYSWRHQIKALAEAGYRVAAPDVRGYGGSDRPDEISAYTMEALTSDIAAIAKTLSPDKPAVVVGHDWGAPIAWNTALLHAKHFHAVAGLSVPYIPLGPVPPLELYRKVFTDNGLFFYQIYFQEEGRPEAELEADPAATIRNSITQSVAMCSTILGRKINRMVRACLIACRNRPCRCCGSMKMMSAIMTVSSARQAFVDRSIDIVRSRKITPTLPPCRTRPSISPPCLSAVR